MSDMRARIPQFLHDPISEKSHKQRYSAGAVLFHEGDVSDGVYILLSGQLKVYAASADGREVVYNVIGPGELFGELSMDGGPRTASVRALSNAECLIMKNQTTRDLMRSRPEFADYVFAKACSRGRHSTRMTRSIALDPVPDRVIALLSESAIPDGSVWRVPRELIQQEIADRIGASREMVHKIIGQLIRDGFIHKDAKHRMTILKPLAEVCKTREGFSHAAG